MILYTSNNRNQIDLSRFKVSNIPYKKLTRLVSILVEN